MTFGKSLPNQLARADVISTVSSGFKSLLNPINDGMTIDVNAANAPKFKSIKFLVHAARICGKN